MTIPAIEYNPNHNEAQDMTQEPVHVINIEVNGRLWKMPIELYNQNIERGKTRFVTTSDRLVMVSEEEYKQLMVVTNALKKQ